MRWRSLRSLLFTVTRQYSRSRWFPPTLISIVAGTSYVAYLRYKTHALTPIYKKISMSGYEKRFRDFASLKYDGVLFMTPNDFLDSLIKDWPDSVPVTCLSRQDVESLLRKTPQKSKGSMNFFRNLGSNGLISYTEYLFLLQILTKPYSSFEIAFKMLDTDTNGAVDVQEFSTLNSVLARSQSSEVVEDEETDLVLTTSKKDELGTTLTRHLFGKNHDTPLTFDDFTRFMHNIQKESLEVEFRYRAMGLDWISATEFARILLRHTTISSKDYESFIRRLSTRLKFPEKITLPEFQKFFNFLNALDDFSLAMKMYTLAEKPISLPEFNRAVKACTGYTLDAPVLRVIFNLFDTDGDGCLSYQEFIQIMRERKSRGIRSSSQAQNRREAYRNCVAKALRESSVTSA